MARVALGWSVRDLAQYAKVGSPTVSRFEGGHGTTNLSTLTLIRQALEAAGVEFLPEEGVRLRQGEARA